MAMADTPETAHARLSASFAAGRSHPLPFRLRQLRLLQSFLSSHERALVAARRADLHAPPGETFTFSIMPVAQDLSYFLRNLRRLTRPTSLGRPLGAPIVQATQPKGVVLVLAPFNFPVMLALRPVVAALAAGNCVALKPSEAAPACAAFLLRLADVLDRDVFAVVPGAVDTAQRMLALRWAHIFFTGSRRVGNIVLQSAAPFTTPVTLELGGKNPALVTRSADVLQAARAVVKSRFVNAGQICLATDYCVVEESIHDAFVEALMTTIRGFFGDDPQSSPNFGRLISHQHFERVTAMLDSSSGKVVAGGERDISELYVAPTVVCVKADDALMHDEVFGPVLSVLCVRDVAAALELIRQFEAPLAFYLFSRDAHVVDFVLERTQSGSVGVNDTIGQAAGVKAFVAGFGGSGMGGGYGGREGFDAMSHRRVILRSSPWVVNATWRLFLGGSAWTEPGTMRNKLMRVLFNMKQADGDAT